MIKLREIDNENTALQLSPMICSAESLLSYLIKHDEIGLTKAKAFQRKFVHWAAANFEWPGFEEIKFAFAYASFVKRNLFQCFQNT